MSRPQLILLLLIILFHVNCKKEIKPFIPADKNRLYRDVKKLTSIYPPRNYKNLSSINTIADYIYNNFKALDCSVEFQKFEADNKIYKNIIASFGPKNGERIIIGAHYDVFGDMTGADDNASAVAGLLETARLINELKPHLKHRIDLVAYSLEEVPFFRTKYMGSMVHALSLRNAGVKVKIMICLEMIGFFSDRPDSQSYPIPIMKLFYPDKANFIGIVGKSGSGSIVRKIKKEMKKGSAINVRSLTAPRALVGIDFSDHQSYWEYDFNAVMITDTAFYRNPNYHKESDRIETLDFDRMTETVKGIYWAVINF